AGGGDGKSGGCADGRVLGLRLGGDGGTYADVDGGIGAKGLPLRVGDDDVIEAGVGVLGAGDGQGGVGGAEDVSSVELPLVGQIVGETDLEIFPAKIIQHAEAIGISQVAAVIDDFGDVAVEIVRAGILDGWVKAADVVAGGGGGQVAHGEDEIGLGSGSVVV